MDYEKQKNIISHFFKQQEKREENFKIGLEFEHFILHKDTLEAVSYYEEKGIESTLKELLDKGWIGSWEEGSLLGLIKEGTTITLEPGSQIELSIKPYQRIHDLEKEYIDFLEALLPILDAKGQVLIAVGYQPQSKISDIPFIPKKRYKVMSEYLKNKGAYAHNMMKGTASIQVTVDYSSEEDYIHKFKVANYLSPVITALFDNTAFFEGNVCEDNCKRTEIWNKCDNERSGLVEGTMDKDFGYERYAEYILNRPPIFMDYGDEIKFTDNLLVRNILDPDNYTEAQLEHALTMFFPDVRTKKFIEIRIADAVPYPLNFSAAALWKGLLYHKENLHKLVTQIENITQRDILDAKCSVIDNSLKGKLNKRPIHSLALEMVDMAEKGLCKEEASYLKPLKEMLLQGKNPKMMTMERLKDGKNEALKWCTLNDKLRRKDNG